MSRGYAPRNALEQFDVGDEVIGDERLHGMIVGTTDVGQPPGADCSDKIREYVVKSENGETFLYAGETNLRLVKKGMGDAAPPRSDLLKELDEDLKYRPLAGLRV